MSIEFTEFPKMPRLSRECIVTEKIDGTNACIFITQGRNEEGSIHEWFDEETRSDMVMFAGSRTRWITPTDDNFGFAAWVKANAEELAKLPPGRHFGEWWGSGIQRGYGLQKGEKRYSLFNTLRFHLQGTPSRQEGEKTTIELPACVGLVPVLWRGIFSTEMVGAVLANLREDGSVAAPGFMKPEGVVVFHVAGNTGFKKTLEKDEEPKSRHQS